MHRNRFISSTWEVTGAADDPQILKRRQKKESVKIDKHITLEMSKDELPNDAIFKGYETRIFQDIKIFTENIEYRREVYYSSPSLNKTIIAILRKGYYGEFGPGIR